MSEVREAFAPAKVNLGLHVTARRADGYHELDSVFAPLDVGDRLRIRVDRDGRGRVGIEVGGASEGIPAGDDNLAARAASAFLEATGARWDVHVALEKTLPAGAGLGGGSSDAAAVLRTLSGWLEEGAPSDLPALALGLGADVPFFLSPEASRVRGIGDRIDPLAAPPSLWLLLVHPGPALATAAVYDAFDARTPEPARDPAWPDPGAPWSARDPELARRLRNDLEPAAVALCPELAALRARLEALDPAAVAMSGSGTTFYAVFGDREAARAGARSLTAEPGPGVPADAWIRLASTGQPR